MWLCNAVVISHTYSSFQKHQLNHGSKGTIFESYIWSPLVSGALVGALQLPMVLCLQYTLGADNVFSITVSQIFVGPVARLSSFFRQVRLDYRMYWQVIIVHVRILYVVKNKQQLCSYTCLCLSDKSLEIDVKLTYIYIIYIIFRVVCVFIYVYVCIRFICVIIIYCLNIFIF